jgi:hypothetical protein
MINTCFRFIINGLVLVVNTVFCEVATEFRTREVNFKIQMAQEVNFETDFSWHVLE